ncbi:hypothetical protein [Shimia sp.]|uniref:hypothetical protein n=1 Tax=Shimia sp. TaxID=1954381 RepID=UPI003297FE88
MAIPEPEQIGLARATSPSGQRTWIDLEHRVFLSVRPATCSLETHAPNALSEAEAIELLTYVEAIVAREFPDLPYDPGARMGKIHKGWFAGPIGTPQRWGVTLFAFPDWGDSSGGSLKIKAPGFET